MLEKKSLGFLARFFAIFGVGSIALPAAPLGWLEEAMTAAEAQILGLQAKGNTVFIQDFAFIINEYCTGALSSVILLALVFSLKKPEIKTKIWMWAIGTIVLFAANIARVYAVLWSGLAISPAIAESVHVATWFLVSAVIIAVWYFLTKKIAKIENFRELL